MIRARDIEHTWRDASAEVRCLRGLDLELEAGEFCCLRGVSGSGKTTVLLTLGGMLKPTEGSVPVREVRAAQFRWNHVGHFSTTRGATAGAAPSFVARAFDNSWLHGKSSTSGQRRGSARCWWTCIAGGCAAGWCRCASWRGRSTWPAR